EPRSPSETESFPAALSSLHSVPQTPPLPSICLHLVLLLSHTGGTEPMKLTEHSVPDYQKSETNLEALGSLCCRYLIKKRGLEARSLRSVQVDSTPNSASRALRKQVEAGVFVTMEMVKDALDQLRGAVMIVYPMGLPPYDPIRMEFENKEDLSGTQAALEVIQESEAQLWWAAKELRRTKKLSDYVGRNEKTKIIVKIQKRGQGAPAREPIISSEEQKQLMLFYHRRQEELKKLEENDDDSCLNSPWADNTALKRHFHG
ncbi:UPF0769 protein C21orf59-like, partial [Sigmodon hispidus]